MTLDSGINTTDLEFPSSTSRYHQALLFFVTVGIWKCHIHTVEVRALFWIIIYTLTNTLTNTHICVYTHTHVHTHTHIYIYIYIYIYILCSVGKSPRLIRNAGFKLIMKPLYPTSIGNTFLTLCSQRFFQLTLMRPVHICLEGDH